MGPHLAIYVFVLVKFWRSLLGLDIYELSDLIIFHHITINFELPKKKFKRTQFELVFEPEPV